MSGSEYIRKDEVIKVIKSGCKVNSVINVLVKDILDKVNEMPTITMSEEENSNDKSGKVEEDGQKGAGSNIV